MFGLYFTGADDIVTFDDVMASDTERFKRFFHLMLEGGVYLAPSAFEAGFTSIAHGETELKITLDAAELEACNKVLSTSTILLNHTVDAMLAHCRRAERIVLIGPSAGCLPDPLFARGVTVVGGSWVTDRAGFIDALRRGVSWSAFAYKIALTAADWPGLPAER